jgi:hypothetical protein
MNFIAECVPTRNVTAACLALGVSRAGFYRRQQPPCVQAAPTPRQPSPRALAHDEHLVIRDLLHSERFVDKAPAQVYTTLLDEGVYHRSTRTMYRILDKTQEVRERRDFLRHPHYHKPELLAKAPNQVTSPSCLAQPRAHAFTYTSSSTSSAATPSAGSWPNANVLIWPQGSSANRASSIRYNPTN